MNGGAQPDPGAGTDALVACLCAEWCATCREFRAAFEALQRECGGRVRMLWIDVEDEESLVDDAPIETFPTLLIAAGGTPRFFGPVAPHAGVVRDLVGRALRAALPAVADERAAHLAARLIGRSPGGGVGAQQ